MSNFPILKELFAANSTVFLAIGAVIAIIAFIMIRKIGRRIISLIISGVTYAACEGVSNIITNYSIEKILLLIGTIAIGYLVCSIVFMVIRFVLRAIRII
jgi:hypothetical protein